MLITPEKALSTVGFVATVALAASGCTVHGYTGTEPVSTYEVTSAPVGPSSYEQYPHTMYEGRQVYYVNGRWGYPQPRGWSYYRSEPAPLVRYRQNVRSAPPAYPQQGPRYEPGPGPQRFENNAPPASAPPAVQVR